MSGQTLLPNNGGAQFQGHIALGKSGIVDSQSLNTTLSGSTITSPLIIEEEFTDGSKTIAAGMLNSIVVNPTANSASNYIGFDGLVQVKSGNSKNITGSVIGGAAGAYHSGSGAVTIAYGILGLTENLSSGTIADNYTMRALNLHTGAGTVTRNYGLSIDLIFAAGTIATNYGVLITTPLNLGGGTLTTNYGLKIDAQTVGTTAIGAAIGESTTSTLWIGNTTTPTATTGGIVFGSGKDFGIYRSGSAAGTITGDLTVNNLTMTDAKNIVLNTSTGTKIGTATSQKLGIWNATPIVQPTTGIAASTFVANTSGIANDTATWDGYTIGQVVKALRNMGILA